MKFTEQNSDSTPTSTAPVSFGTVENAGTTRHDINDRQSTSDNRIRIARDDSEEEAKSMPEHSTTMGLFISVGLMSLWQKRNRSCS